VFSFATLANALLSVLFLAVTPIVVGTASQMASMVSAEDVFLPMFALVIGVNEPFEHKDSKTRYESLIPIYPRVNHSLPYGSSVVTLWHAVVSKQDRHGPSPKRYHPDLVLDRDISIVARQCRSTLYGCFSHRDKAYILHHPQFFLQHIAGSETSVLPRTGGSC